VPDRDRVFQFGDDSGLRCRGRRLNVEPDTLRSERRVVLVVEDELAERVGRSRISVSDWERGVKVPGVTAIPRLVAELDIPVELLVAASQHTKKNIEVAA